MPRPPARYARPRRTPEPAPGTGPLSRTDCVAAAKGESTPGAARPAPLTASKPRMREPPTRPIVSGDSQAVAQVRYLANAAVNSVEACSRRGAAPEPFLISEKARFM